MSKDATTGDEHAENDTLNKLLLRLQLPYIRANYHELAQTAAEQQWGHLEYLQRLIEAEVARREDKSLAHRIRRARFPLTKTLDQFQWNWPKKINRPQIQNLFRLNFVEQKSNAIFFRRRRPREDPSVHRARSRRLRARLLGAVHHRHRHHPHPVGRGRHRLAQAHDATLSEAQIIGGR